MMVNLELENMLVGHFIGIIPHNCNKPISYVMQRDGLWEIRKNSLGTFCKHAAKTNIPGLPQNLEEGFELSVPKVPLSLLWQTISFFRKVYELHRSEAIVRVIYDLKSKKYFLDCPPQTVSAGHCNFDKTKVPQNCILVAEIHSHGGIGASFSGTDDKDELADRFYGVVGKISDFFPEISFRVSIGGKRLPVDIYELFNIENDPMLKAKFPPGWLDHVKKQELPIRSKKFHKHKPRRFLDDPEDFENESLFLPNWDELSELPNFYNYINELDNEND